jgi:anhydro-N-acetylmuramic acid kinase
MGIAPDRVIVCGGGRRNPTIMAMLQLELDCPVLPAETVGWDSDAIEAQAFAYLAVRVLRGLPNSFPTTTGVPTPTVGGRIVYPA